MADGFQEITALDNPNGINDLNRMLKKLFDYISGDGEEVRVFNGFGSPESSVTAKIGSIYMRADGGAGTTLYVKESGTGATGWVAK